MNEQIKRTLQNWRWWAALPVFVPIAIVAVAQAAIYHAGAAFYRFAKWQSPFHNPSPTSISKLNRWVFQKHSKQRDKYATEGVPPIPLDCWLIVRSDGMFSWVMPGDVLPTHWYGSMAAAAKAANKEAAKRRKEG